MKISRYIRSYFAHVSKKSFDYIHYWDNRYRSGGNSGLGSYNLLAEYKANVINGFVQKNEIESIIEFGCGDGNQLSLGKYPNYLGFDVSKSAIDICARKFQNDKSKSFILYSPAGFRNNGYIQADLVLCLDVLYHITDFDDFYKTLSDIFSCASRFVILYTNIKPIAPSEHIANWDTVKHLSAFSNFSICSITKQEYPEKSSADFIFLRKNS